MSCILWELGWDVNWLRMMIFITHRGALLEKLPTLTKDYPDIITEQLKFFKGFLEIEVK